MVLTCCQCIGSIKEGKERAARRHNRHTLTDMQQCMQIFLVNFLVVIVTVCFVLCCFLYLFYYESKIGANYEQKRKAK